MALLVPSGYWPDALRDAWKANTDAAAARLEANPAVTLTAVAANEVRAIAAAQRLSAYWLRVGVKESGGSWIYVLDLVTDPPNPRQDLSFSSQSIPVIMERSALVYLDGTVIDFRETVQGRGFLFENPNARK